MKIKLPKFLESYFRKKDGLKKYQESIKSFLSDSTISVEEGEKLAEIKKEFGLSEDDIKSIHQNSVNSVFVDVTSDKRITDNEKKILEKLLNHFSLSTNDVAFSQDSFNKYYTLALIDKGILPAISNAENTVNIIFKEDEILHWAVVGYFLKRKKVTTRINYGGFTGSVRIMKGLSYRVGSVGVQRVSSEILDREDSGMFYITNQRIGYMGYRKQFSFPFKKIGALELRCDGLHIFKDGKEAPYILELRDYEVALSVVSSLMNKIEE